MIEATEVRSVTEIVVGSHSVIGQSVPPVDAREKVTGQAQYGGDIELPGMLQGKILRSPHPHARILAIDVSRARALPGVRAVITAADVPQRKFGPTVQDQTLLAIDKVRYVGDEVAAVAAVDRETATEALGLIHVEYEPLPAVYDPEEALHAGAPQIHSAPDNVALAFEIVRGDVRAGFAEADVICEERYVTSLVHHTYIEPNACVAAFDASGRLTLWLPNQSPFRTRINLSKMLGIPVERIRVIQTFVGGGFGGKTFQTIYAITALLAQASGKPVRAANTREEELQATVPRMPAIIDLKMGARRDGRIVAKEMRVVGDNGAYTVTAPAVISTTSMRVDSLYRLENVYTTARLVYTNKVPTGQFRGYGNPQGTFAVECMMDSLAAKLGMDPAEIRLRNATRTGDVTVHGWAIRSCGLSECIERATAAVGWQRKRTETRSTEDGEISRGVGIGCCIHVSGNRSVFPQFDGSSAFVRIDMDGRVTLFSGEADLGQGMRTAFAQIVAEELGLTPDRINIAPVDTDVSPFAIGTFGSRVTTLGGNAVKLAAADARAQLFRAAAGILEAAESDLVASGGRIFVRSAPEHSLAFPEVAARAVFSSSGLPVFGRGAYVVRDATPADPATKYGSISVAYPFAAHVVEVAVDRRTGKVKVLRVVAAHDVGKAINPAFIRGQIEGGVTQGLGYALTEEMTMVDGRVVADNLLDYKVFTALDAPRIDSIIVETEDPFGPYGAKGVGEPAIVPVAPAVANAIYDAVGVRITTLPITPQKILEALAKKQADASVAGSEQ